VKLYTVNQIVLSKNGKRQSNPRTTSKHLDKDITLDVGGRGRERGRCERLGSGLGLELVLPGEALRPNSLNSTPSSRSRLGLSSESSSRTVAELVLTSRGLYRWWEEICGFLQQIK
jgi:hypothetical protein